MSNHWVPGRSRMPAPPPPKPKKEKNLFVGPRLPSHLRNRHRQLVIERKDEKNRRFPPRFVDDASCQTWWRTTLSMMGYELFWISTQGVKFYLKADENNDASNSPFWEIDRRGDIKVKPAGRGEMLRALRGKARDQFAELIRQLDERLEVLDAERRHLRATLIAEVMHPTNQPRWSAKRHGQLVALGRLHEFRFGAATYRQVEAIFCAPDGTYVSTMLSPQGVGDLRISAWTKIFQEVRQIVSTPQVLSQYLGVKSNPPRMAVVDVAPVQFIGCYRPDLLPALKALLVADLEQTTRSRGIAALAQGWRYYGHHGATCPGCRKLVTNPEAHVCAKPKPIWIASYEITVRVEVDADSTTPLHRRIAERLHEMTAPDASTLAWVSCKVVP